MGVYDGLQHLKNRKARLYIGPLAMDARILDFSIEDTAGEIRVEINDELPAKEKVKALIHEALHFGYPYNNYLPMRNLPPGEYTRIENEIDGLAQQVYECQPRLRLWLENRIQNA